MDKLVDYIITNVNHLSAFQMILIVVFVIVLTICIFAIFKWLYSNRFTAQKELLSLKNESIGTHKARLLEMKESNRRLEVQLSNIGHQSGKYKELVNNLHSVSKKQEEILQLTRLRYKYFFNDMKSTKCTLVLALTCRDIVDIFLSLELDHIYNVSPSVDEVKERVAFIVKELFSRLEYLIEIGCIDDDKDVDRPSESVTRDNINKYHEEISNLSNRFIHYLDDYFAQVDKDKLPSQKAK